MTLMMSSLFLVGATLTSGSAAQAATATAGGACTTVGATTTIAGKSYSCVKALSGKSVWTLKSAATTAGAKPSVAGGHDDGRGGFGGPSDEGSAADATRHAAMAKYSACLTSHGGTAMNFGGPGGPGRFRGGRDDNNGQAGTGAQPTTPSTFPTPSAGQQKAMTACASLAPKFGGPGFPGGNH